MEEQKDEQLMEQFQSGNKNALQVLFARYVKRVFNFCLRLLGNQADAEDATQDVFLKLFNKQYAFQLGAKFSTWLFTIARNCCFDRLRKRKREVNLEDWSSIGEENANQRASDSNRDLVAIALDKLPSDQREALVLREYQQFSYAEISEIINCSLEKVKILIFRGREQMRAQLEPLLKEGIDND